jgi:hypothetical protein
MVRSVILAAAIVAVAATGCKSTIRQYDTQACSTNPDDDPLLVCSPALDLVCISTHSVVVTNPKEAVKWDGGIRPVYVCRIPCATDMDCIQSGDVCCSGPIYGKTYGKMAACAPRGECDALKNVDAGLTLPDSGSPDGPAAEGPPVDAPPADGAGADGGADAATPDGGAG